MYSAKQFDNVCCIGPAFEELSNEEMYSVTGGDAWTSAATKAAVAVAVWSSLPCGIGAVVASAAVTLYSLYKKYN